MFSLSGAQKEQPTAQPSENNANARVISEELIGELEHDHEEILGLIKELSSALSSEQFSAFNKKLKAFKSQFNNHVMTENLKLYTYLKSSLVQKSPERQLMAAMRREMNDLNHMVAQFCQKYAEGNLTSENQDECDLRLSDMAHALMTRFTAEEKRLFALYK